jgi:hypothetical protein
MTREGEPKKRRLGLGISGLLGRDRGGAGEGRAARKESRRLADVVGDEDPAVTKQRAEARSESSGESARAERKSRSGEGGTAGGWVPGLMSRSPTPGWLRVYFFLTGAVGQGRPRHDSSQTLPCLGQPKKTGLVTSCHASGCILIYTRAPPPNLIPISQYQPSGSSAARLTPRPRHP